jgi:hypothetical protein
MEASRSLGLTALGTNQVIAAGRLEIEDLLHRHNVGRSMLTNLVARWLSQRHFFEIHQGKEEFHMGIIGYCCLLLFRIRTNYLSDR